MPVKKCSLTVCGFSLLEGRNSYFMQRKNFYLIVEDYCALLWLAQRLPGSALPHPFPLEHFFFFSLRVATWAMVVTFSMACWRSSSDVFLDRQTMKVSTYARRSISPRRGYIHSSTFERRTSRRTPSWPGCCCCCYPQQHTSNATPRTPVRQILAGLLRAVTDDVGKQSPRNAYSSDAPSSVRASRRQHGDGHLCKPRRAKHVVVQLGQHDGKRQKQQCRSVGRAAPRGVAFRVQREKRSPFSCWASSIMQTVFFW